MAANFKVVVERHMCNLKLFLSGDFDGASAYTLLNVILRNMMRYNNVTINTNELKTVENYGVDVFNINVRRMLRKLKNVEITGKHKERFIEN